MCCCCPPAINALFCLWIQSGCSKGTVAGALTFFPPEPALYNFERVDADGNPLPDDDDEDSDNNNNNNSDGRQQPISTAHGGDLELQVEEPASAAKAGNDKDDEKKTDRTNSCRNDSGVAASASSLEGGGDESSSAAAAAGQEVTHVEGQVGEDGHYHAREGQAREKVRTPAQQVTDRAKELRKRAKERNARDRKDAKNDVHYKLVLDPRLVPPRFQNGGGSGGGERVEAVKIPCKKGSTYCAAIVYRVPPSARTSDTRTIIYSHGNATDIGAMFPLQSILSHSLECNVVSYDYSGYGESGGIAMEANTYTDIQGVFQWTVDNLCNGDESRVILYGQSVGSGPCCHLACRQDGLGGMILHSPFMSGMRVLTPSR